MKNGIFGWLILLLAVVLGIALVDAGAKKPVDWSQTYNFRDKIPFGLYVFREEIPNILAGDRIFEDFGSSIYEETVLLDSLKKYDRAILDIGTSDYYYEEDVAYLLKFVRAGGEIFISSDYLSIPLQDSLNIQVRNLDFGYFAPSESSVFYSLVGDRKAYAFDRVNDAFSIFAKLDPKTTEILGYTHSKGLKIPNFIKVNLGKGALYLHTLPQVFSNYHILQKRGYDYVHGALNVLQNEHVLLYDEYYTLMQSQTPLRVLLNNPGFAEAWYLLLLGLVLLLIFKSKREQRAVEVVLPEQNLSKEFAKTIGSLYYENGEPGNIVLKKIEYFLFFIRSHYHIDTLDLSNDRFQKELSMKSNVGLEEIKQLLELIVQYRERKKFTLDDVKYVNKVIEDFKTKANII